jgi:hypothetical protein
MSNLKFHIAEICGLDDFREIFFQITSKHACLPITVIFSAFICKCNPVKTIGIFMKPVIAQFISYSKHDDDKAC